MQIKDQWKGSKNWKLVTGVATAATLGFGAIAGAAPSADDVPKAINLNDRAVVSEQTTVPTTGGFVAFDLSVDDTQASVSESPDASADDTISAQGDFDASPSVDGSPSVDDGPSADDSISQESLDASPQASIDDSVSAQDDSFDSASDESVDSPDASD